MRARESASFWREHEIAADRCQSTTSFGENVLMGGTSYQIFEV